MKERVSNSKPTMEKKIKKKKGSLKNGMTDINEEKMEVKVTNQNFSSKWYEELKCYGEVEPSKVGYEELTKLRTEANSILNEASILNTSKAPRSLSKSDYGWVKTVMSKGTKTDKIAAYTLIIQDSPVHNLSLLRNMIEKVKIGKNKECFMAIDTLCELFLTDLLPPDRKLLSFEDQPLSKLDQLTSGNITSRRKLLLLWMFEDQLKSLYGEFVNYLNRIAHDSVEANKEKVITVMCKLLERHPEREEMLLNNIVNKLGDPSHKVGSKVIYALTKLLEVHPNMREVVVDAVEKVIFRTNIKKRAQYYSICFLSQFCLFRGDGKIAKKLIMIYLSLFKVCIKTGDVDSRMMSALLTGVNRAYPYAKEEFGLLKDHINTIYKVIHLSHANIAIQALSLVHLVSDYSHAYVDRFYSVLYKKIGEADMFKCSHHAMFLSLIFRALKKDNEKVRVCAFIKRLLQVCMCIPVPVTCGVLIMISQILKNKKDILLKESVTDIKPTIKIDESDDEEEHYEDVKEEADSSNIAEEVKEVKEVKGVNSAAVQLENIYNIKPAQELKIWSNPDRSVSNVREAEMSQYDPFVRNPLYAGANKSFYCELFNLERHYHPTISLFAKKIMEGEHIIYSGDPLLDFTLIRFLDKFSFKNPKAIKPDEEKSMTFSMFGRKKYYSSSTVRRLRANTADYLNHSEKNIPVDEVFLYRYMKEKWQRESNGRKDDNSDADSVGSDEFEEMLNGLADGKRGDINFLSEVGQLPKKSKKTEKEESESEVDFEGEDDDAVEDSEEGSIAEDFEGDEVDNSDEDLMGSDFDEDEVEAELEAGGIQLPKLPKAERNKEKFRRKSKGDFKNSLFASAEEFSELLEDADNNAGGSEALSNKDKAGAKQLKWESERDKWIHKKNFRSKGIKRSREKMKHPKVHKGGKKKRF